MSKLNQISPREMLVNMCHFWHKASNWNPKMKKYIYWIKNWVHIFDLEQSSKMLVDLLNKIVELVKSWKTILFVSTKAQTIDMLKNIHETTWMPVLCDKWMWWLLTNFSTIKQRVSLMKNIKHQIETWEIEKYTKKEQSEFKKQLEKLEKTLWWIEWMNKLPDAIFVVDWKKDEIALVESRNLKIITLWIADSNANPDLYDYFVPVNDDSIKSLEFILWFVEEAILNNKQKKTDNNVEWLEVAKKTAKKETWEAWWVTKLKK